MKIPVYKIEKVIPSNEDDVEDLCDIFNVSSLRFGYVEMVGELDHYITKSEFNKEKKVYAKFYDRMSKSFIEGSLFLYERFFVPL